MPDASTDTVTPGRAFRVSMMAGWLGWARLGGPDAAALDDGLRPGPFDPTEIEAAVAQIAHRAAQMQLLARIVEASPEPRTAVFGVHEDVHAVAGVAVGAWVVR